MLIIRRAAQTDMDAVRRLIEALESPHAFPAEPFRKNYMQSLTDPGLTCLVARDADGVAAFGSMRVTSPLHHTGPVAEVVELIVDERRRGNGIGARLIGELLALARWEGCCVMEIASNRARKRAHQFYTRLGFVITHVKLTMDLSAGDV
jgi:PhnO protein